MSGNRFPAVDVDLFSDEVLTDPYPVYKNLRDIGGAVYLEKYGYWALPRYETVRFALANPDVFTSNEGVAMTDEVNVNVMPDIILNDDGETHRRMRAALQPMLTARAIQRLTEEIDEEAERLVSRLFLRTASFDGIKELAEVLPVSVVARLIGLPAGRRMRLLDWSDAAFASFGPMNDRTIRALPGLRELFEYVRNEAARENLTPGSWGTAIYEAGDRGDIPEDRCFDLMLALVGAGMETTIGAIGSLFHLFSEYPDEWDKVRADPELAPNAFSEAIRLESPVICFTRVARRDFTTEGITVPAGSRTVVLYASANRDERKWPSPDLFDVERDTLSHLAFGYGLHSCVGQPLARIEATAMLKALIPRVGRFHTSRPTHSLNNVSRRIASLPMTITPVR